jgi:hypothetical protein
MRVLDLREIQVFRADVRKSPARSAQKKQKAAQAAKPAADRGDKHSPRIHEPGWSADTVRLKTKNPNDFWCGVFFVALGALAMYLARDYARGDALDMGPGYFPTWLGGIMICFGVAIGGLSFRREGEDTQALEDREWGFRPWLVLPATLAAYAFLMDADVGFVPSLVVLIIGCALAHKDVHWRETILLSIFVTAGAVAIFSYGIGMPYRLFWWSH